MPPRAVELASAAITNGLQIFPEILAGIRNYCERKDVFQGPGTCWQSR